MKRTRPLMIAIPMIIILISCASGDSPLAESILENPTGIYVSTEGDDENPGTEEQPLKTIQEAANMAEPGSTIYIKAGIYSGDVIVMNSGAEGNYITFKAFPGDEHSAIIEDGTFKILGQRFIWLEGIRVQNSPAAGVYVEGPANDIVIKNNYTYNTFESGIIVWGVPWKVDPGEYDNVNNLLIEGNKVEMACNGGWNESITLANGVNNWKIINNEIFNGGNPENGGEGIDIKEGANNGIIAGNYLHGLTRRGIYLDGGGLLGFRPPEVQNIEIFNNISSGQAQDGQAQAMAIMTEGDGSVHDIKIYNNLFYGTDSDGLMFYKHPAGSGLIYNIIVVNNTMANNSRNGILLNFEGAYNIRIENNIAYDNKQGDIIFQNGEYIESNNLTNTAALFVDAAAGNYRLLPGSPAIDAGTDSEHIPPVDFDGNSRVGRPDIGAIEFVE